MPSPQKQILTYRQTADSRVDFETTIEGKIEFKGAFMLDGMLNGDSCLHVSVLYHFNSRNGHTVLISSKSSPKSATISGGWYSGLRRRLAAASCDSYSGVPLR